MSYPNAGASLRRLPGRQYVDSARQLRQEFLAGRVDTEAFLKAYAYHRPKTKAERFQNQVQSYATASLVIEQFWEYLHEQPFERLLMQFAERYRGKTHTNRVQGFNLCFLGALDAIRNLYVDQAKKRKAGEPITPEYEKLVCFFAVARRRHQKLGGLPFPSMADLVTMTARMAQVAPAVFKRDTGRELPQEGLFCLLRHPYLLRLYVEIMANDRPSTHPLFARLEGAQKSDLNNLSLCFDPDCFEIYQRGGLMCMQLRAEVVQKHLAYYKKAADRRAKRGKPAPQVLGCPALYTGKLTEMHTWVRELFERWYAATA